MEQRLRNEIEIVIQEYKNIDTLIANTQNHDDIKFILKLEGYNINEVDDETIDVYGSLAVYTIYNGELINSIDYVDYNLYSYVMSVEDFEEMLKKE